MALLLFAAAILISLSLLPLTAAGNFNMVVLDLIPFRCILCCTSDTICLS